MSRLQTASAALKRDHQTNRFPDCHSMALFCRLAAASLQRDRLFTACQFAEGLKSLLNPGSVFENRFHKLQPSDVHVS
jgi:hypothetical protein